MHFPPTLSWQATGCLRPQASSQHREFELQLAITKKGCQRALVIDARGAFDPGAAIERGALNTAASGLTAISLRTGSVGNAPHRMQTEVDEVARANGWIASYPKVFIDTRWGSANVAITTPEVA